MREGCVLLFFSMGRRVLMSQIKAMKADAKQMLRQRSNRLGLVTVGILLIFSVFLPMLIAANLTCVIFGEAEGETVDLVFYAVWGGLTILCTAPALILLYRRAYWLYRRQKDGLSAPRVLPRCGVLRCLVAGLLTLIRPVLLFLVFVGAYALAEMSEFLLYVPLVFCAVAVSVLVMWLTGFLFLFPYYICRGESVGRAIAASAEGMKHRYRSYGAYMLAFLGWVLLSLLTAGVLLILNTLPLMLFTYFIFADRVVGDQQTEDDHHE